MGPPGVLRREIGCLLWEPGDAWSEGEQPDSGVSYLHQDNRVL